MLFKSAFTSLISIVTLLHTTLADPTLNAGAVLNKIDQCSNIGHSFPFGASKGAEFCVRHPEGYPIRSLSIWSNATMIGGIKVTFMDNTYGLINVTHVFDHPTYREIDLHPSKKYIRDIYAEPQYDKGLLEGIAVTVEDGTIFRAGKNVTNPSAGYSSWLYLAGISGYTGTHGIEQLTFIPNGWLGNNSMTEELGNGTYQMARRQIPQWQH